MTFVEHFSAKVPELIRILATTIAKGTGLCTHRTSLFLLRPLGLLFRLSLSQITTEQPLPRHLPISASTILLHEAASSMALMQQVHVRFLRYSAFYTPLLLTIKSDTLKHRGIKVTYDKATPQRTVDAGFADGTVQVAQSAPAVSFRGALTGQAPVYRHFALMNTRDGFFLGQRTSSAAASPAAGAQDQPTTTSWQWDDLVGRTALIDHFFQPMSLFRTALRCQGVPEGSLVVEDAGGPDDIEAAFRAGRGDIVHLQGPGPQQLEQEGMCKVVASVGAAAVPLAFSSLCATPEWLTSPAASAFMSAFCEARTRAATASAADLAQDISDFLPEFSQPALTRAIDAYQRMGTWLGSHEIDPALYDQTVKVFLDVGYIDKAPPMDLVVSRPPAQHLA